MTSRKAGSSSTINILYRKAFFGKRDLFLRFHLCHQSTLFSTASQRFTLARIAGHSSITIIQRYVHPQADAIERAFAPFGSTNINSAFLRLGLARKF